MYSRPPRRPHVRRRFFTLAPTVLVTALLANACTLSGGPGESSPAAQSSMQARSGRVDISNLSVPRTALCSVLDQKAVTAALDGPVSRTAHYDNGDEVEVTPGYSDVVHEYGCVFRGGDGATAQVWVFARPVARQEARTLVRRARHRHDCSFPRSADFGRPGLTSVCEVGAEQPPAKAVRARLEGLFADSWVGCEVSEPDDPSPATTKGLVRRAARWCTGVVASVGLPAG